MAIGSLRTVFVFALGPDGHKWPFWPFLTIYGHLAIGPCATNSGKWGIPEKYKNVDKMDEIVADVEVDTWTRW